MGYLELMNGCVPGNGTDAVYRTCYRACAGGPFEKPPLPATVTRRLEGSSQDPIEQWDNDGMVNTQSMLWPKGENVLVPADHMDIVGHFQPTHATPGDGRKYQTYDLLKSTSGFGEEMFNDVWKEIFAFSVGKLAHAASVGQRQTGMIPV